MTRIAVLLVCMTASICFATAEDAWINNPPTSLSLTNAMPELDPSQFVEVPISLADNALGRLTTTPIVELSDNTAQMFHASCASPKKAYLVRAIYEHGNTGTFHVKQKGSILWVLHYALGAYAVRHRSALVVCTATVPTTVYVSAGGAM